MKFVFILLLFPILLISVEFAVPFQVYDADIVDIDNDNDLDIVIASLVPGHPEPPDSLTFLINNGYGEFSQFTIPKHNFAYLKMVDIDCDGLLDICTKNSPDYQLVYYKNLGNLQFSEAIIIPAEYTYVFQYPKFNDIDSDGDIDIIINHCGEDGACNILFNDGAGVFNEENAFINENGIVFFDINDIDNDNLGEILITTHTRPFLYFNNNFNFSSEEVDQVHWSKPYILDMNNDQHNDIVLNNDYPSLTKILYNDGTGHFFEEHLIEMPEGNIIKDISDYNNDGYPDFAISINSEYNEVWICFNNGDGTITEADIYYFGYAYSYVVRSADLNGNGFNDLLVTAHQYTGRLHSVVILFNDGTGNFLEEQTPFLHIIPNSIHVDCNAGNSSFEIRSNTEWLIEQSESWVTLVEPLSGIGNNPINIGFQENTHNYPRTALLHISGTNADTVELLITQSAASGIYVETEIIIDKIKINNYPNPFNPETIFRYSLPANVTNAVIEIFNVKGARIENLKIENVKEKNGEIIWDGTNQYKEIISSGIYFYRIKTDAFISKTKRMVIVK